MVAPWSDLARHARTAVLHAGGLPETKSDPMARRWDVDLSLSAQKKVILIVF